MSIYNITYQNNIDTDPESEPESDTELESESESNSKTIENNQILNKNELKKIIKLSICYYDVKNIPKGENLVCYFCLKKCLSDNIKNFSYRTINNKSHYDILVCPHCKIDSIISLDKLRLANKNHIDEVLLLRKIKRHMCFFIFYF